MLDEATYPPLKRHARTREEETKAQVEEAKFGTAAFLASMGVDAFFLEMDVWLLRDPRCDAKMLQHILACHIWHVSHSSFVARPLFYARYSPGHAPGEDELPEAAEWDEESTSASRPRPDIVVSVTIEISSCSPSFLLLLLPSLASSASLTFAVSPQPHADIGSPRELHGHQRWILFRARQRAHQAALPDDARLHSCRCDGVGPKPYELLNETGVPRSIP